MFMMCTLIHLVVVFALAYCSASVIVPISSCNKNTSKLMARILSANMDSSALVKLVSADHCHYQMDFPLCVHNLHNTTAIRFEYRRYDGYVIILTDDNLREIITQLSQDDQWNPRAKFVINLSTANISAIDSIFDITTEHYMHNVVTVDHDAEAFINLPFKPDGIVTVQISNVSAMFPPKLPKHWNNATLRVDYVQFAPYLLGVNAKPEGLELDLIRLVAKLLNIHLQFTNTQRRPWGHRLPNGTWVFGFRYLQLNTSDLLVGFYHLLQDEATKEFDYLYPYWVDPAVWVVPRALYLPMWLNLVRTFQLDLWFWLIVTLVITSLMWVLIFWQNSETIVDIYASVESPFKFLIEAAISTKPHNASSRILFVSWWVFCFITLIVWKSNFVTFLTTVNFDHQIASLIEAMENGLTPYTTEEIADYYNKYEPGWIGPKMWDTFKDCNYPDLCFNQSVQTRKFVVTSSTMNIRYAIDRLFIDDNGHETLHVVKEPFNSAILTMYTTKGMPLKEHIDKKVQLIFQYGFWKCITGRFSNLVNTMYRKQTRATTSFEVLTVQHMKGPFFLMLMSFSCAFLVLLLEIIVHKKFIFNKVQILT